MEELQLIPYTPLENKRFEQAVRLIIKKSDFYDLNYKSGTTTYTISNCDFIDLDIENTEEIDFPDISLHFVGCYIRSIEIATITSKNISVFFNSSLIGGRIRSNNIRWFSSNNCIVLTNLFLLNLLSVDISYTEENIFPIRWRSLFRRNSIRQLNNVLRWKQTYFVCDCLKISFSFNLKEKKGGCYRQVHEKLPEYKIGYYLSNEQKKLLDVNLDIKYGLTKEDSETQIENAILSSLSLSGNPKGKISVETAQIRSWYLRDFVPKGEVSFYSIIPSPHGKVPSKIEFHKSNLDNVWFDSTNFASYELVSFYRTKFAKTTFTSCNFPNNSISFERFTSLKNVHYPEKKRESYYKDQYEIYLQLKLALEATGNFFEAQKLFAISNDALRKVGDVPCWDKVILWINRKSNNHGLSIKRPLFLFFAFSILLYVFYLFSLNRIFNFKQSIDFTLFGYYFSFVDVTHRNDFLVEKNEFNSWSLFLDYFNKVVESFFIYQFIAAFRKYGKK